MSVDGSAVPTSVAVPGGVALFTSSLDKANAFLKEVMLCGDEMGLRSSVISRLARWTLHGVDVLPQLYR